MRFATNETLDAGLVRGPGPNGTTPLADDPIYLDKEIQGLIEGDLPLQIHFTQPSEKASLDRKRSHKSLRPEKQVHPLS